MEQSSSQAPILTGNNTSQIKFVKDPTISPASSSPKSFNFQSYNLNILVQHYDDKIIQNDLQKFDPSDFKNDQLSQIQEDNSENTPQTVNSNYSAWKKDAPAAESSNDQNNIEHDEISDGTNLRSNSPSNIVGNIYNSIDRHAYRQQNSGNNGDQYDQRLGAVMRGKLFTLQQDLESFEKKEKQEQDEIFPLTEEFIDHKSFGWGSGKETSQKNPLSMSQQLALQEQQFQLQTQQIVSQQSPLKKHIQQQSRSMRNHQVTIRTPDLIWKQKLFFIACNITRVINKMKQINIFKHPEQLYHSQLNAINDKAAKDIFDDNWGKKQINYSQNVSIPTPSQLQARRKYKFFISRYRLFRKKARRLVMPTILKCDTLLISIKRKFITIGESISPFDSTLWFTQMWCYLMFTLSIAIIIYLPYEYSFKVKREGLVMKLFEVILPIIFFLNIIINSNTSFFQKGNVIHNKPSIIWHYLKTNFIIDILSTLSLFAASQSEFTFFFYLRIFIYQNFVDKQIERLLLHQTILMATQFLSFIFKILLCFHFISCIWYLLGNYLQVTRDQGWLNQIVNEDLFSMSNNSTFDKYLISYFIMASNLTMLQDTSLIIYKTREERLFLIVLGVLSIILFSMVTHTVQQILYERDKSREEYLKQLKSLSIYYSNHDVEPNLKERSCQYLEYMSIKNKERQGSAQEGLKSLSNYLQQEIIKDVFLKAVKKVSLFQRFFSFNPKFLEKLALKSVEVSYGPDELIMRKGTSDIPQLYFVTQGEIQLFVEMGSRANIQQKVFKVIKKNQCFGMYEFFSSNSEVQLSAKSLGVSRVSSIKLDHMRELLKEFPKEREAFCYLRDSITFKQDFSQIGLNCFSCHQINHYALECPYLFYGTQPQKIMKEMNKNIKHIIQTFKRSQLRKKQNFFAKSLIINKKVEEFQQNNQKIIETEEDLEGSSDESAQFLEQSILNSSDSDVENHVNQSRFDKERKSILRGHSGSSKFSKPRHKDSDSKEPSSREENKTKHLSASISKFGRLVRVTDLNSAQDEISELKHSSSYHTREKPISLSNNYELNTVGRVCSAEFFNNEDSRRLHSMFKRSESEQQRSFENILDRGEYNQEEDIVGEQLQQRSDQRHSTHQTSKTNKTNKTTKTAGHYQFEIDNPSLNSLQKTNSANQEGGLEIDKNNNQFNNKGNLIEPNLNISPIVHPRKESSNSNSSNMLIQLINPNAQNSNSSGNNMPSFVSQPPHSSFITQVLAQFNSNNNQAFNNNNNNLITTNNNNQINNTNQVNNNLNNNSNSNINNQPSSSSTNINIDKLIGGYGLANGSNPSNMNSNPNYNNNLPSSLVNNIPNSSQSNNASTNINFNSNQLNSINPISQAIISNNNQIAAGNNNIGNATNSYQERHIYQQNSNSINTNILSNPTIKQSSGHLNQQQSQSISSQRFNQQYSFLAQQEQRISRGQRGGQPAMDSYSASIGTVKSFELYFPQNNVENIIERYNKLQRKKVSRRVKRKNNTYKPKDQIKKRVHLTTLIQQKNVFEPDPRNNQSLTNLDIGNINPQMNTNQNISNSQTMKKNPSSVKKDVFSLHAFSINDSIVGAQRMTSIKVKS